MIQTDQFVMIDNRLISRNVPPHALSEKEFKRLLHLWATVHIKFGNTYNGQNEFNKVTPCSRKEYVNIMNRLEQINCIRTEVKSSKVTYTTAKMMPLYDNQQKQFISVNDDDKTKAAYMTSKEHFTMVPKTVLLKSLRLSVQEIKLLLKLYKYNNSALFGGIDPNAVVFSFQQGWYINPRIPYDLYMDEDEVFQCLHSLLTNGFFELGNTSVRVEKFDFEPRFMIDNSETPAQCKILIPTGKANQ